LLPKTGYTWTEGIETHFTFSYSGLYIIISKMGLNMFLQ